MLNVSCTTCIFSDSCPLTISECKDYYPAEDIAIDNIIDEMIEQHHKSFYQEWTEYIDGFYK